MLSYRLIDDSYAPHIYAVEQAGPQWFVDASNAWHKNYDEFLAFYRDCYERYGLFDGDKLVSVIYLEHDCGTVNLHISVLAKVDEDALVRFFRSVKFKKKLEGVQHSSGWILEKNRGMLRIGEKAGYRRTGLKMDFGADRKGRIMRWIQVIG